MGISLSDNRVCTFISFECYNTKRGGDSESYKYKWIDETFT